MTTMKPSIEAAAWKGACICLINPTGGGGGCRRWFAFIQDKLLAELDPVVGPCTYHLSKYGGHMRLLAREATLAGANLIVAVGGDGTLNEVVNGIMSVAEAKECDARPKLACLPAGTGGDFARSMGWSPGDWRQACARIKKGRLVNIDVGLLTCRSGPEPEAQHYFLNEASCGFTAHALGFVPPFKRMGAFLAYMLAGALSIFSYRQSACRLRLDEGEWMDIPHLFALAGQNGQYMGGGLRMAPLADPGDGQLLVVLLEGFSILRLAFRIFKVRAGYHIQGLGTGHAGNLQGCSAHAARIVEVEAAPGETGELVLVEADGELLGQLPARMTLLPGALRLVV